jgi:NAD(P)-dependent dehydrogenase (short-subunit alcohol dehydrogenase family)
MSQRIAVVTGGSRGLGKSTVLALAERGVNSIFTFVTKSAEADVVISAVTKTGTRRLLSSLIRERWASSTTLSVA